MNFQPELRFKISQLILTHRRHRQSVTSIQHSPILLHCPRPAYRRRLFTYLSQYGSSLEHAPGRPRYGPWRRWTSTSQSRPRLELPKAPADCLQDTNLVDNSETVYISSLALLKMLRHGRAGVPMEVMGLMLGEFVDDYTVRVVDVFAMPQSGTGVSVEAVDPVFQTKMMDMLRQTGR